MSVLFSFLILMAAQATCVAVHTESAQSEKEMQLQLAKQATSVKSQWRSSSAAST